MRRLVFIIARVKMSQKDGEKRGREDLKLSVSKGGVFDGPWFDDCPGSSPGPLPGRPDEDASPTRPVARGQCGTRPLPAAGHSCVSTGPVEKPRGSANLCGRGRVRTARDRPASDIPYIPPHSTCHQPHHHGPTGNSDAAPPQILTTAAAPPSTLSLCRAVCDRDCATANAAPFAIAIYAAIAVEAMQL